MCVARFPQNIINLDLPSRGVSPKGEGTCNGFGTRESDALEINVAPWASSLVLEISTGSFSRSVKAFSAVRLHASGSTRFQTVFENNVQTTTFFPRGSITELVNYSSHIHIASLSLTAPRKEHFASAACAHLDLDTCPDWQPWCQCPKKKSEKRNFGSK